MLYISYYLFAVLRHVPLNKDLQALTVRNINNFTEPLSPTMLDIQVSSMHVSLLGANKQ